MFTSLLIVSILILVSWVVAAAYYLYTSRQHEEIEQEIESLNSLLSQGKDREG